MPDILLIKNLDEHPPFFIVGFEPGLTVDSQEVKDFVDRFETIIPGACSGKDPLLRTRQVTTNLQLNFNFPEGATNDQLMLIKLTWNLEIADLAHYVSRT